MKKSRRFYLVTTGLMVAVISSCAYPSRVEENWGSSQRANVAEMIADPTAAAAHPDSVIGLDPATAERVMENHRRSQKRRNEPQKLPSIINVGIGTGG
jgi:hypothetical protein